MSYVGFLWMKNDITKKKHASSEHVENKERDHQKKTVIETTNVNTNIYK